MHYCKDLGTALGNCLATSYGQARSSDRNLVWVNAQHIAGTRPEAPLLNAYLLHFITLPKTPFQRIDDSPTCVFKLTYSTCSTVEMWSSEIKPQEHEETSRIPLASRREAAAILVAA
jgi:hypothetical protein